MENHPTRILTVGASCINRFQFEFFQTRHPDTKLKFRKSFFDWNITTLVATEAVLRLAVDQNLLTVLSDTSLYYVKWNRLIFNSALPGFCFYHEKEIAERFDEPGQVDTLVEKLQHQAASFLNPKYPGRTHLVWSNIQPNLPVTVNDVLDWSEFKLTDRRYTHVKTLAQDLFGSNTSFSFLANSDDMSSILRAADDVTVVDLPRGDTFRGEPGYIETLLPDVFRSPNK